MILTISFLLTVHIFHFSELTHKASWLKNSDNKNKIKKIKKKDIDSQAFVLVLFFFSYSELSHISLTLKPPALWFFSIIWKTVSWGHWTNVKLSIFLNQICLCSTMLSITKVAHWTPFTRCLVESGYQTALKELPVFAEKILVCVKG